MSPWGGGSTASRVSRTLRWRRPCLHCAARTRAGIFCPWSSTAWWRSRARCVPARVCACGVSATAGPPKASWCNASSTASRSSRPLWCPGTARHSICRCSPTAHCSPGSPRRASGRPERKTPRFATTTTSAATTGGTPVSWTCCRASRAAAGCRSPPWRVCWGCRASSASGAARCGTPGRAATSRPAAATARPTFSTPGSFTSASRRCAGGSGARIRLRRTRRHRQHDDAELLEVLEPSGARVAPRCAHFGVCGGCALQHLAPAAQREAKQTELAETLARVGRVQPARWLAPLAGPVWAYRRRARLGVKFVRKKGCVVVGFRERAAPYVAQLTRCEVLAAPVGELIAPLAAMLTELSIREQVPQIEVAIADNASALVLRVLSAPSEADAARLRQFGATHGVRLYLQPAGLDSVVPLDPPLEPLRYTLARSGVELEFSPVDFIQVNGALNEALVERAAELLELDRASRLLDLYCGLGNFTLALARSVARAVGVEGAGALIEGARGNAARNGIANAEFHLANLATPPEPTLPWMRQSFTHVLLDPPRTGAAAVLAALAALAPQRVLYISCHPGSLARDLSVLVHEHGFALQAAGVVDMFPHTTHVESLALLTAGGRHARRTAPPA